MEFNKATIKGSIQQIGETMTFESGFSKREIVIDTGGEYRQSIAVSFMKDKTSILDNYGEGQVVEISADIRGREYNGRFFNDLVGWKINAVEGAAPQQPQQAAAVIPQPAEVDPYAADDDLPF